MVRFREAAGSSPEDERIHTLMQKLEVHSLDSPGYVDIAARMELREDRRSAMQRLFLAVLDDARTETLRRVEETN
jgi:hypothetical protein